MSEMIERVAKALYGQARDCASQQINPFGEPYEMMTWDDATEQHRECARKEARAAIEAMREPTEAMANHPMATCYNYGPYGDKEVNRIWRAMINAALSEKP